MCIFQKNTFEAYTTEPGQKHDYYKDGETQPAYRARMREVRTATARHNAELNTFKRVIGKTETRSRLAAENSETYDAYMLSPVPPSQDTTTLSSLVIPSEKELGKMYPQAMTYKQLYILFLLDHVPTLRKGY